MYIGTARRQVDFIAIFALSGIVYHLPALWGAVLNTYFVPYRVFIQTSIAPITYVVLIINLLTALCWMIAKDILTDDSRTLVTRHRYKILRTEISEHEQTMFNVLMLGVCVVTIIMVLISIYNLSPILNAYDGFVKQNILAAQTQLDRICKGLILFIGAYAFTQKGRFIWSIRIISILLQAYPMFIIAQRSFLVFLLLIIGYILINRSGEKSVFSFFAKYKFIFAACILGVVVVFTMKSLIPPIMNRTLTFELLSNILINFWTGGVLRSEFNTITVNLNEIIRQNFSVSLQTYRYSLAYSIPFIGLITDGFVAPTNFGALMQAEVFPQITTFGVASTFLGEAWSNGGLIMVLLISNFVCFILAMFERGVKFIKNPFVVASIFSAFPFWSFFIYRTSLFSASDKIMSYSLTAFIGIMFILALRAFPVAEKSYNNSKTNKYLLLYRKFFNCEGDSNEL